MKDQSIKEYAAILGRLGGEKRSPKKTQSSRQNGKRGGRPPIAGITNWAPFMNALDESRKTKSTDPFFKLYSKSKITKERALILSTVRYLCSHELCIPLPEWARNSIWLKQPWFVSGVENLKAFALIQSPIEFRSSHIFVLDNFLERV